MRPSRWLRLAAFGTLLALGPAPLACDATDPDDCCAYCPGGTEPCGDVCILTAQTCQVAKGCACDASERPIPIPTP